MGPDPAATTPRDPQPDGGLLELASRIVAPSTEQTDDAGPLIIGVGGSVAVGKTTIAEALRQQFAGARCRVDVVSTDGFLLPNAVLDERGLAMQKGTPQSHDTARLVAFLDAVRSGVGADAPRYSHETYDIVPDGYQRVVRPDVLILEGLHVLQTAGDPAHPLLVSDHLDITVYVDADEADIERWFVARFMEQRAEAVDVRTSFFRQFVDLDDDTATSIARWTWTDINRPTLREYVVPRRPDADLVVEKAGNHSIRRVRHQRRTEG